MEFCHRDLPSTLASADRLHLLLAHSSLDGKLFMSPHISLPGTHSTLWLLIFTGRITPVGPAPDLDDLDADITVATLLLLLVRPEATPRMKKPGHA